MLRVSKKKQKKFEKLPRVITADFGRGFGLFIILILHLFIFWGFKHTFEIQTDFEEQPIWVKFIAIPFQFLGSWASVFAIITGISTTYIMHYQIQEKQVSVKKRLLKSFLNGLILLGINFIYVYFFTYPSNNINNDPYLGMIPASIKEGKLIVPDKAIFFIASPLSMIAFSNFFIVIICTFIWNNGIKKDYQKYYLAVFSIVGALFIGAAEPLKNLLLPNMQNQYNKDNFLPCLLLAWMIGPKLSIFPYVGFAFFGAIYGLFLREDHFEMNKLKKFGVGIAICSFILVLVDAIINGIPSTDQIYDPLYFPFFTYMFNLGAQNLLALIFIKTWDTNPVEERRGKRKYYVISTFQRLSIISLTVFMLEETTAALYTRLTLWLMPVFLENVAVHLLLWGPLYVFIWIKAITKWEKKYRFKYSLEWFLAALKLGKKLTTDEDILDTENIIYKSRGYRSKKDFYRWKKQHIR